MSQANTLAKAFKQLHQSNTPVLLANVWDTLSARTVAVIPSCKALATSSFAVAGATGTKDDNLTLATNLEAVKAIARVAKEYKKPLTVDIQDGYGAQLEDAFAGLIDLGVSGANLEDFDREHGTMYTQQDAVVRIERVLCVVKERGVPEFVLNARCDTLAHGGSFENAISRGKAYLGAGATTVFVIPGPNRKIGKDDINEMVRDFNGCLNIGWNPSSALSIRELTELGVARVSVGPGIQLRAMELVKKAAEHIMSGGGADGMLL